MNLTSEAVTTSTLGPFLHVLPFFLTLSSSPCDGIFVRGSPSYGSI
jgi:hypothetical protein